MDSRVEPEHAVADAQTLLLPERRVGCHMAIEIALVRHNADTTRMLDDDLAARYQDLVERQRRYVRASCGPQRVAARLQRSAIASSFARGLNQRDLAVTGAPDWRGDLDDGSRDKAGSAHQRASWCWPFVDVDETRWRRGEDTGQ